MTAIAQAPERVTIAGAPRVPQVNLLPPEVYAGRVLSRIKVWLGIGLMALALVLALAFVWVSWNAKQVEQALAEVQDRNQSLLSLQAQYSEVPQVLGAVSDLTDARAFGTQSETLWQPYLAAIAAVTPTDVSIGDLTVTETTPWSGQAPGVTDPLATSGTVGVVSLSGRSLTVPDTVSWEDGLAGVPGVVDVDVVSVQLSSEQESVFYQVTATMRITTEAFAQRFTDEEG